MTPLESGIDEIYRQPLEQFVEARTALASQLKGDEARRVKQLKKPTAVPWAVNQVYWHARPVFDRVLASGSVLRLAQIAVLEGRAADVRDATKTHRDAVGSAVAKATEIARAVNVQPSRDALTQTFEALSLAPTPFSAFGRLTQPLQPGGFEMLAGVEPAAVASPEAGQADPGRARTEAQHAAAAAREREAAAARRDAAIKTAEAMLARARSKEAEAERAWRQAQDDVETARRALQSVQS